MFNKTSFDKSFYNRSGATSVPFGVSIRAVGDMSLNLLMQNQLSGTMSGVGGMTCGFYSITVLEAPAMQGGGGLSISDLVLFVVPMTPPTMNGEGILSTEMVIQTPLEIAFSGSGEMTSNDYVQQVIECEIRADGDTQSYLELPTFLEPFELGGVGDLAGMSLLIPLDIEVDLEGSGELVLRRLTEIGYDVIELVGINLAPGGVIKIDTDLLTVAINGLEDVSSVTSESTFFEMEPGDTEIKLEYDGAGNSVRANAIWQNRWL